MILIDKPKGPTSQQVVAKVKYLLQSPKHNSKKAGHTGTLDPMATGLLPICLGEATKFSHYQLDADKRYQATVRLGIKTDTGDAEGQSIATTAIPTITQAQLDDVAKQFTGDILQTPPMYSALKKDGRKLYEYAREGIEIERAARPLTIHALTLSLTDHAEEITLDVTCSKGTYVRVLGEDIAKALGTLGHLSSLHRSAVGDFQVDDAISLEAFETLLLEERFEQLMDIDECVKHLPSFRVDDVQRQRLMLGQRLNIIDMLDDYAEIEEGLTALTSTNTLLDESVIKDALSKTTTTRHKVPTMDIRLFDTQNNFLGLGQLDPTGRLQPKKMIQR